MAGRLLDRSGVFIWSAAPQTGTQDLYELHNRAQEQRHLPADQRTVDEFHVKLAHNPHIKQKDKDTLREKLSPEQARILIEGEYAIQSFLVYPEFSKSKHGIPSFEIPPDWTRYKITDSGRQVCAVLFIAVPPPDHQLAGKKIVYDELYLKQCSATIYGEAVAPKVRNVQFEDFIIDHSGAGQTEIGSGKSIEDQYCAALAKHGLSSRRSRSRFSWGSDDKQGGLSAVRTWLEVKSDGKPTLLYFQDRIFWLVWEFERYHNQRVKGELKDKPVDRNDHLMDCCRYAAMNGCEYAAPKPGPAAKTGVTAFLDMIREKKSGRGREYVNLGPDSK